MKGICLAVLFLFLLYMLQTTVHLSFYKEYIQGNVCKKGNGINYYYKFVSANKGKQKIRVIKWIINWVWIKRLEFRHREGRRAGEAVP